MHRDDVGRGKVCVCVVARDRRVVPFRDLAGEDLGDRRRTELQLVDAAHVVRHRDRGRDGREVEDVAALVLRKVGRLHEAVGSREVDGLGLKVGLTLPGAATGIVHRDA